MYQNTQNKVASLASLVTIDFENLFDSMDHKFLLKSFILLIFGPSFIP